jgi:hypothetical protein
MVPAVPREKAMGKPEIRNSNRAAKGSNNSIEFSPEYVPYSHANRLFGRLLFKETDKRAYHRFSEPSLKSPDFPLLTCRRSKITNKLKKRRLTEMIKYAGQMGRLNVLLNSIISPKRPRFIRVALTNRNAMKKIENIWTK